MRILNAFFFFGFLAGMVSVTASCGDIETPPPNLVPVGDDTSSISNGIIFKQRTDGYACFRIPAIIKTTDGTLLAFAEARKLNCSDEMDIDLVMKRSTDNGKTWSDMIMVWDDGANTCGNPAPVVDAATGKVHLLMTWNLGEDTIGEINNGTSTDTRRVFVTNSTDDGLTWQTPREITSSVKLPEWGWYATGPCHGIQLTKGQYAGRMVIPCDNIGVGSTRKGYSHVIYSDDGGETWKLGGVTPQDKVNESTVAELSDGKLMLNMRNSGSTFRRVSVSTNGGETWGELWTDTRLIEPVCQGSLLSHNLSGRHVLFFSNPASTERVNMTLRMSEDDGNSWAKSHTVHTGPSAYSDIVMVSESEVGILYEAGVSRPYESIVFKVIPVQALK
jgi:sialidase-1